MRLVRSKTTVPVPGPNAVVRHRIVDEIRRHLAAGSHVRVNATAGAGKTTAVATALLGSETPVAWLTLDGMDASPGRLLVYIEAALQGAAPTLPDPVADSLRGGGSLLDTAAFLAEALEGHELVFVADETEKIADSAEARDVLDAFILNLPPSVRSILIGREDMGERFLDPLREATLVIQDHMLAFTADEAREVLAGRGVSHVDAAEAVKATGGWITGILYESWRYSGHQHGDGGEADPLSGYLSKEIMGRLSERQRSALVVTSLLDEVTPPRAEALGVERPGEVLHSLSNLHLPLEFNSSKTSMRCHPRFREYLQSQLQLRDPDLLRSIRHAYGQLLVAERRPEEAVDEFLAAGDAQSAASAADTAISAVLERLDFSLGERWLDAIGTAETRRWPRLVAAAVQIACEAERYGEGAEHADRLLVSVPPGSPILTPSLVTTIAWCYFLVSRIEDAQQLLNSSPDVPDVRMMRFIIKLELLDDPTHYRDRPPECHGPADGLMARADLAHGRFACLLEPHSRPWAAISLARIGALRALGRTAEAAQLMEAMPLTSWTAVRMRAEIMADTNQPELAYTALLQGRDHLARSGSNLYRMFDLLLEASLALRFRKDTQFARAALNEVAREPTALRRARIVEQLHLWRGLAALIDRNETDAVEQLRAAVKTMTSWDRLLYLPTAATYLAEAEWRLGNVDEADRAADLAIEAAERQGSRHLLIQALKEFPAVVSRRLDAEAEADSVWHTLGRAVLKHERVSIHQLGARVTALDIGAQAIDIDGEVVVPKLAKSVELLAFLAWKGGRVPKPTLINNLFENSSAESAAAYLRMAVNGLRKVLPPDVPFGLEGQDLVWTGGSLTSTSMAIQSTVTGISGLPPSQQQRALDEVLSRLSAGELLPSSRSEWVVARRAHLEQLYTDVLEMAADAAYHSEDYRRADQLVAEVLQRDALRERSWRLAMRVASALGDRDRVTSTYRRCCEALADIGAAPEADTTALARRLRGEPATLH